MSDKRRDQIIELIEKEFIGPDPIDWDGMKQENGEEILRGDPPRTRYISGILFPQATKEEDSALNEKEAQSSTDQTILEDSGTLASVIDNTSEPLKTGYEYLEDAEELINLSNAYKPSAMSITAAVKEHASIFIDVSAGVYRASRIKDNDTETYQTTYLRTPINWNNSGVALVLPKSKEGMIRIDIPDTRLRFNITYRYTYGISTIYTFTLENSIFNTTSSIKDEDCYFQVKFKLNSKTGFLPIPEIKPMNFENEDDSSNQLLYRNVRNYAIGHGCSADWDDDNGHVSNIYTSIFPRYDISPIVPNNFPEISLDMFNMSDLGDFTATIKTLNSLCEKYDNWIEGLQKTTLKLENKYQTTASKHIQNCKECLQRMRNGIDLLLKRTPVRIAFQFMNHAMLLQQLHSNLPLQKWAKLSDNKFTLVNQVQIPQIEDPSTWYKNDERVYGKWRPFQLAFILMNLESMFIADSNERSIVDLIWFPTGGGKTEAYLGLSAYTIFLRRQLKKSDSSTAILMRYTLRLLTAQQYQRAASMICACEFLRRYNKHLFGEIEISIGLWVGGETSPNTISNAVRDYDKLKKGMSDINPFVVLQCPWCGAQMGPVKFDKNIELFGYKKDSYAKNKYYTYFQCSNSNCDYSTKEHPLPLYVIDEDIYEKTPTLIIGTVDKFAMLPFRPEAQGMFGFKNGVKISSPDLIIQDELHLISGPLGSMVGHYETLIFELCTQYIGNISIHPKIIASTATISRAREQCHALYNCKTEDVFQFPPMGLDAGDSFFAREDTSQNGRRYIGIIAPGASSEATTSIRLMAALLHAAKSIEVEEEQERDPYWTNIGYYNSIRELGNAATWIKADIEQYLDIKYKRRYDDRRWDREEYHRRRRYIYRSEELTSRIRSDKVTESLENLKLTYPYNSGKNTEPAIDICLATNMISVGLDVPRLGLMTVNGQPKTTSEYIQATSRVGRDARQAPGLVFIVYKPGRPRDKSHYEQFKYYHSKIYTFVEPTSVTPFSAPVRERALHAILIGLLRLESDSEYNKNPPKVPIDTLFNEFKQKILTRIAAIDEDEVDNASLQLNRIRELWEGWKPQVFQDFMAGKQLPLMFPAGNKRNLEWGDKRGFKTQTSMRNVDAECKVEVLQYPY